MNRSNLYKIALAAILCSICSTAFAQTGNTWKKKVARVIDLVQKEDNKVHHLTNAEQDMPLLEMMATALKAGKLNAYAAFDNNFTSKLSPAEINQILGPKIDTVTITNPIDGKEETKIIHRDFDMSVIHKYRILEEWTFDTNTGKTDIQITGIAPIRDIYGDDGVFRGVQAMFWVHFNDLHSILAKYDQYHPDNNIGVNIWNDYFLSDVKPAAQK